MPNNPPTGKTQVVAPLTVEFDEWFEFDTFKQTPELRFDVKPGVSQNIDTDVLTYFRLLIKILFAYPNPQTADIESFSRREYGHCLSTGALRVSTFPSGLKRLSWHNLTPIPDAEERLKVLKAQPGATPWLGPSVAALGDDDPTEPDKPIPEPVVLLPPPLPEPPRITRKLCYICARVEGESAYGQGFTCQQCKELHYHE